MRVLCDSSVLIAALLPSEDNHAPCSAVLTGINAVVVHVHALNETFATLTGGALGFRVDGDLAVRMIREQIVARSTMIELNAEEVTAALGKARAHGVRGGAVYDYMHLVAARKGKTEVLYTLNLSDFKHLHREGDPEIRRP
jgi:predicted nucleic acid-binding protein